MDMDIIMADQDQFLWDPAPGVPDKGITNFKTSLTSDESTLLEQFLFPASPTGRDVQLFKNFDVLTCGAGFFLDGFLPDYNITTGSCSATSGLDLDLDLEVLAYTSPESALDYFTSQALNDQVSSSQSDHIIDFSLPEEWTFSWMDNAGLYSDPILSTTGIGENVSASDPDALFMKLDSSQNSDSKDDGFSMSPFDGTSGEYTAASLKPHLRSTSRSKSRRNSPTLTESVCSSFSDVRESKRRKSSKITERKAMQNVKASRRYREKKQKQKGGMVVAHENLLREFADLTAKKRDLEIQLTFAVKTLEGRLNKRERRGI